MHSHTVSNQKLDSGKAYRNMAPLSQVDIHAFTVLMVAKLAYCRRRLAKPISTV